MLYGTLAYAHRSMGGVQAQTYGQNIFSQCPKCSLQGWFTFHGTQRWPEAVARAIGQPMTVSLYTCQHCCTTLTEGSLRG